MEISSGLLLIQFTDSEYQYPVSALHVNDGCLSVSCFLVYLRYLGIIKEFLENKKNAGNGNFLNYFALWSDFEACTADAGLINAGKAGGCRGKGGIFRRFVAQ